MKENEKGRQQQLAEEAETAVVKPLVQTKDAITDLKAFQDLKAQLLSNSDYQAIQGKNFIKKSGWRKLALVFNISDEVVYQDKQTREDGSFVWTFRVRAIAPNGRYTEAVAGCDSKERKFSHMEHDVEATAHTRAKSRAISDLIGAGETSAEEMDYDAELDYSQRVEQEEEGRADTGKGLTQSHIEEARGEPEGDVRRSAGRITSGQSRPPSAQSLHAFDFKLNGSVFPVEESEEPFSRFFINKVCKGISSKTPGARYEITKNDSGQAAGIIWHNIDEKQEREIYNTLQWTLRKVEQNRRQSRSVKDSTSSSMRSQSVLR
ncbi:MAG TPA: hypothetical protein VFF30_01710 [Nitrososphaerales archaeon]|nr:hypothetical protein [Nitrososphaerales archaeon]